MTRPASRLAPAALLLALALPAAAGAGDFSPRSAVDLAPFRAIEEELRSGRVGLEEAIALRELAVKAPWELAGPWRALFAADPVPGWAATATLVENQQWRTLSGSPARADYAFPEELAFHLDSAAFPIRVYYDTEAEAGLAQEILEAADAAWQKEVVEWGFYAPPLVTDEGRYRIYIGETSEGVGGYMDPFAGYPDVPWDACVSYVLIAGGGSRGTVGPVVAHELNHAMQGAMDCLEAIAFWENTATFVMSPVCGADGVQYQNGVLADFQSEAHHSLSWGEDLGAYWYGGFLWPHFLAYAYEDEADGPILVRRIWEGAMQEDGANTVNYLRSIDDLLQSGYGADLGAAFEAFSVARFFLDERAGAALATIKDAHDYSSNPPLAGVIAVDWTGAYSPQPGLGPEGYGVNYWALEASPGFGREVTIAFESAAEGPWALLLFSAGEAGVQRAEAVGGSAQLSYTPSSGEDRFLAVVRGGGEAFDPDEIPAEAAYALTVGPSVPGPEILGVDPAAVAQSETAVLTIEGAHFQEGAAVSFAPAGVAVSAVAFVDDATLDVTVTAAPDAPVGRYSLTVTNPDGGAADFYSVLEVTAPVEEDVAGSAADGECACRAAGSSRRSALLGLLTAMM